MTQLFSPSHSDSSTAVPGRVVPLRRRPDAGTTDQAWGWALVEIRADGSWGEPQVVPAPGAVRPCAPDAAAVVPCSIAELSDLLKTHMMATGVGDTSRHEVTSVLLRAAGAATPQTRASYLGPLAHVEALQGDLRRAARHAAQVRSTVADHQDDSRHGHLRLAEAWVALERADFEGAQRHLDALDDVACGPDVWMATSHLLLDANLRIATGAPEAAIRLLATRAVAAHPSSPTDWLSELATITHAEALIACGEPQRAMAVLTPAPQHAVVEAMVLAALARRMVGDVRGALAVLSRAVADLDHAPLAFQVQAWLLEARMAEEQARPERARLLVDRALRSATAEEMRRPVMRDGAWVRRFVEREPELLRAHHAFLTTCQADDGPGWWTAPAQRASSGGNDEVRPAVLTEREAQVLQLLAQMYSTEEIAAALYVSANTVKTHLKGIFNKLGVNRRVDAVRRGRSLGLC